MHIARHMTVQHIITPVHWQVPIIEEGGGICVLVPITSLTPTVYRLGLQISNLIADLCCSATKHDLAAHPNTNEQEHRHACVSMLQHNDSAWQQTCVPAAQQLSVL
jgi:hypothetical protein